MYTARPRTNRDIRANTSQKKLMKIPVALVCSLLSLAAFSAPNPKLCDMIGALAQDITQKRDEGMSYKNAIKRITAGAAGLPKGVLMLGESAVRTAYLDQPTITPAGAYSLHYMACMSAK